MDPTGGGRRDLVQNVLRERAPEFRSFVRARARPSDVDDILQVAAIKAIERADRLRSDDKIVAWLYRIHRNLIVDSHRRAAAEQRHIDHFADVPERPGPTEAESCACSVSQAQQLRPSYAEILTLVVANGVPLNEAAQQLGVSTNNATVRLHRARAALQQAMLEHCDVASPAECATCRCVDDGCCAA